MWFHLMLRLIILMLCPFKLWRRKTRHVIAMEFSISRSAFAYFMFCHLIQCFRQHERLPCIFQLCYSWIDIFTMGTQVDLLHIFPCLFHLPVLWLIRKKKKKAIRRGRALVQISINDSALKAVYLLVFNFFPSF